MHSRLPRELFRAEQVRELDRLAIEEHGIPGITLMERAGRFAFLTLRRTWPTVRRPVVVCGHGNNAGDGFVVARLAAEAGLEPVVVLVGDRARLRGDAREAFDRMCAQGVEPRPFDPPPIGDADAVVDALLGTGLEREVSGSWARAVEEMNRSPAPVLSIDVPSGLHADSGRVLGVAVAAAVTVTFIGLKQGLFTGRAREHCGRIEFDGLGVPGAIYEGVQASALRADLAGAREVLPARARAAHKGAFGHVLVVGGDRGYAGAARLAGEAAARVGAGLVSVATRPEHVTALVSARPELMAHGVEDAHQLAPLLERATVIAIGPGLGRESWGRAMLEAVLHEPIPCVVDADGLNLLAESRLARRAPADGVARVITPHPGEAARLLDTDTAAVERDRFESVRSLAARYLATAVLKGAGSLVHEKDGPVWVCDGGNPGMASGGMGDVLTGIIAGLMAQGAPPEDAARAGVCLHAAAGDAVAAGGERGLLASDLFGPLRTLLDPP